MGKRHVGFIPEQLGFDGADVWVTIGGDDTIVRLNATNGVIQKTYALQDASGTVLFDGTSIWVAGYYSGIVTKISRDQ